ncbi:exopolyphosphatase [Coniochaeta ligniaria NRRL 30616]|uniref:Exopolyphosphatase n=1 Tax=Coniochaeta ligniaria NRRL 30616 TaxID=1408157 RepID=A0A1J7JLP4_9PEZI|nr:exopolyphosphatase [Coniochaeta ligniaria NRRL 30616]
MAPRSSLKSFLTTARKTLLSPPSSRPKPLTFVIGNESADLDSLCSALALAYLRTHSPPHHTLHIPLANLHRPDLALRPELGAVLRRAGVALDDLLTLSELEQASVRPEDSRWVLVDHNAVTGLVKEKFAHRVVACVDHHEDEGAVPMHTQDEPRVVKKCGSCMSLVVEYGTEAWTALAEKEEDGAEVKDGNGEKDWDAQLAFLVLGPILIDTTNLTSKDKTTPTDVQAVEFAEALIRRSGAKYDRNAYFKELTELKEDLSSLSYRDIFRKDYKKWTDGGLTLGTSSVAQGIDYLLERIGGKDEFLSELRKWAEEEKLDIACVMTTMHPEGGFAREGLLWGFNEKAVAAVKAFADKNREKLGLETWRDGKLDDTSGSKEWRACWRQLRIENSRKQVAPMLREAMRGASK